MVIAPFATELSRFSRLAQDHQINVILPYQRGASLNQLVPLDPQGLLHPLSPSQQSEIDQLAIDTLAQGWRRIMVVADPADRAAGMAVTYTEAFEQLGGKVESYEKSLVAGQRRRSVRCESIDSRRGLETSCCHCSGR